MPERPHQIGTLVRLITKPNFHFVVINRKSNSVHYTCRTVNENTAIDNVIVELELSHLEIEDIGQPTHSDKIDVGAIVCHSSNKDLKMVVANWMADNRIICRWLNVFEGKYQMMEIEFYKYELTYLDR